MKYFYDLHIHSALSPCGDEDMTPNNIVNMAMLLGLDMIAVTDHNSAANLRSVQEVSSGKIKLVPGIEVTTAEEVHVLCYFPSIDAAEDMAELLKENMQKIDNRPEIFGRQLIMNSKDEIIGEEKQLLTTAVRLDIYDIRRETTLRGGMFVPAHIDRSSYSIISNLGFFPPDLDVDGVEITAGGLEKHRNTCKNFKIFTSSDAHYLENISEPEFFVDSEEIMTNKLVEFLCNI